jgi:hypothetical protein
MATVMAAGCWSLAAPASGHQSSTLPPVVVILQQQQQGTGGLSLLGPRPHCCLQVYETINEREIHYIKLTDM